MSGENNNDFERFSDKERLEWIQLNEQLSQMKNGVGVKEKMTAKIKENPLVPIGMLATTIALSFGLYAMKTGNKRRSQMMMRARIAAQGFTIAAILGGIVYASAMKPSKTKA